MRLLKTKRAFGVNTKFNPGIYEVCIWVEILRKESQFYSVK